MLNCEQLLLQKVSFYIGMNKIERLDLIYVGTDNPLDFLLEFIGL